MDVLEFRTYLLGLQDRIIQMLQNIDGSVILDQRELEDDRSFARPTVITQGLIIEKAACNFTHAKGAHLPKAATDRRPELASKPFQAVSLSWIIHPKNPYVPTTHGNLRFFMAGENASDAIWWFGGGIDLTPYYGFLEDTKHWHQTIKSACVPFGEGLYEKYKDACDKYFYLPHRKETRGVGGIFFEDFRLQNDFTTTQEFVKSIGEHFIPAYFPILQDRMKMEYGQKERNFQCYRRGRYVEFNLLYDRGTHYGLQSGRRIESVLSSMPPVVHFEYDRVDKLKSAEANLQFFLQPRDWLSDEIIL